MYKCIVKKVVLFLIIVFLLSSTAFAAEYTKYGSVEANAAKLVGGPDGYWIYYQAPSLATSYLSPITSGVTYWNNTFHSTTFDIHYTTSANSVNYSNSKLRFVAGNYGMGNDMFAERPLSINPTDTKYHSHMEKTMARCPIGVTV